MIDVICMGVQDRSPAYLRDSISQVFSEIGHVPTILFYAENALKRANHDLQSLLPRYSVNPINLSTAFFCYYQLAKDNCLRPRGCLYDGSNTQTFAREIDTGGVALGELGGIMRSPPVFEYSVPRNFPTVTQDGKLLEFRVCSDVWAATSNKPDVIFVSAYDLDYHHRTLGRPMPGIPIQSLTSHPYPLVVNDSVRGIYVAMEGKMHKGEKAQGAAAELGLNLRKPQFGIARKLKKIYAAIF